MALGEIELVNSVRDVGFANGLRSEHIDVANGSQSKYIDPKAKKENRRTFTMKVSGKRFKDLKNFQKIRRNFTYE